MLRRHRTSSARIRLALRRWLRFSWLERLPQLDVTRGLRELFTRRRNGRAVGRVIRLRGLEVLESREVANDVWNMVLTGVGAAGVAYLPTPGRALVRGWECVNEVEYVASTDVSAAAPPSRPASDGMAADNADIWETYAATTDQRVDAAAETAANVADVVDQLARADLRAVQNADSDAGFRRAGDGDSWSQPVPDRDGSLSSAFPPEGEGGGGPNDLHPGMTAGPLAGQSSSAGGTGVSVPDLRSPGGDTGSPSAFWPTRATGPDPALISAALSGGFDRLGRANSVPLQQTAVGVSTRSVAPAATLIGSSSATHSGSTPPPSNTTTSAGNTATTTPKPWGDPVLGVAQPFGQAGLGHLYVQGTIASSAPVGATTQIDFFERSAAGARLLGSSTVTSAGAGATPFHDVLKADVSAAGTVVAVLHGSSTTASVQQAAVLDSSAGVRAGLADSDVHGIPTALENLAWGKDASALRADTAAIPDATHGDFVQLSAPGLALAQVKVLDPPVGNAIRPWGQFDFNVLHVQPGGSATVTITLPAGSYPTGYDLIDPKTGLPVPFMYDGTTGAEIHGNVITLHFVDGGRGDADGTADGVIVDPGGPTAGNIYLPTDNGLGQGSGWTTFQTGGSGTGQGTVTFNSTNSDFVLTAGNSFDTGMEHSFVIPSQPNILTFSYSGLSFGTPGGVGANAAFEAAFADSQGNTLVSTIGTGRNAFFNVSNGQSPALGAGTSLLSGGTVDLDISKLFPGTTGTLILRLVNNDGDGAATVSIYAHPAPATTVALADDTAPPLPGGAPYTNDLLTTDPTIAGIASDNSGIAQLLATVDGGTPTDITSTLQNGQYRWYPGALAPGSHTVVLQATNNVNLVTTASLTFRVDTPPVANAGGNQTINEGSLATFDGSLSTSAVGPLYDYLWTFPDGSTEDGAQSTYRFLQPGTFTVKLTVTDIAGATATDTSTVTVVNLPPVVAPLADQSVAQRATLNFQTSFTYAGPLDTHTATINWGDGTSSPGTVTESNGSGTVTGSHSWAEEGFYPVTVTVTGNGGASGNATFTATVTDVAPSLTISGPATVAEGSNYALNLSAGGSSGADAVQSWTINWGDGTSDTVSGSAAADNHVYADGPHTYTITATGNTDDTTLSANTVAIAVTNLPPALSISGASSVNEGTTYTLAVNGVPDPVDHDPITSWTVTWGDGSSPQTVNGNPTSLTHVYADGPNNYTVSATASDADGTYSSGNTVAVTVNNTAPTVTANNISGAEGQTLSFAGSFTDPGTLDTHTATINWGDGHSSSGTVTESNGSGTVTGSHVYTDKGSYTITLTVSDENGASGGRTATASVASVPPSVSISGVGSVLQGSTYTLTLSGVPDSVDHDPITGWTISWGDGSTTPLTGNPTSATHVYTTSPAQVSITATASDADGTYSSNAVDVAVLYVAPTVAISGPGSVNEAGTETVSLSATGGTGTITGWSVAWGDGAVSTLSATATSASHVYTDGPNDYTVVATATDANGNHPSNPLAVHVNDVSPVVSSSNISGTEGQAVSFSGAFTDAGIFDTHTASINWGDGSAPSIGTVTESSGTGTVTASHVYADKGVYTVSLTVSDENGTSTTQTATATIANVPPAVSISGAASVNEGSTYTLTLSGVPDSVDQDPITGWKITWGDGSTQPVTGNPTSLTHVYASGPNHYTISATATDADASYSANTVAVTVNDVSPTVVANNLSGTEGATLTFSGSFTDPGIHDTHTASINWGDGTSSTGTVTESNGSGTVTATHIYPETGTYTITLKVTDSNGPNASQTATANIANVNPTVTPSADATVTRGTSFTLPLAKFTDPGFSSATNGNVENFSASINWGDGSAPATGTVNVVPGSAGVLTTGTVSGSHTFAAAGDYDVTITVSDDDGASGTAQLTINVPATGATKFYVIDHPAHQLFRYDAQGNFINATDLSHNNQEARGIATDAAMDTLWTVDANKHTSIYVYNPDGSLRGMWTADGITNAQDITTDGSSIWIVDKGSDTVECFVGGAGYLSGDYSPTYTFALDPADQSPSGVVTDGQTIWVTDNQASTNNVFVYDTRGNELGSWHLDAADSDPTGITINPNYRQTNSCGANNNPATDLWVVDGATARVYQYAGASAWRSGSHSATSTFALNSNDQHPDGIADPVSNGDGSGDGNGNNGGTGGPVTAIGNASVTIQAPVNGAVLPANVPVLVTGYATPTNGATGLGDVVVNGTAAVLDAAGNFFAQITADVGTNVVTAVGVNNTGGTGNASVSFTGVAPLAAGKIDPTQLSDVTASMSVAYGVTSFNNATSILYAGLTVRDAGDYAVNTPLLVTVRHLSDPSIRVQNPAGYLADGTPYYDLSKLVTGTKVSPGQSTQTGTLSFYDPQGISFTYDLGFLAQLNRPPRFTSVPVVTVQAGKLFNYHATAYDPDGDFLTFSKVSGPTAVNFTDTHAGTLAWLTTANDVGTYPIDLRVSDGNGGTADQFFVLSVVAGSVNYPPVFTSTPVVDGKVNTPYSYQAAASDLDGDTLTFSVVSGPAGLTINATTGLVLWTPTDAQVGSQTVKLQVTDAGGLSAVQTYTVLVLPQVGDRPPVFLTTPVTTVAANATYAYPSKAMDPDGDPITYSLKQPPAGMVVDPTTGRILWLTTASNAGHGYVVNLVADDGRGGRATQTFTVNVTSSTAVPGNLYGTVYNDLNGDGIRDIATRQGATALGPIALQSVSLPSTPVALTYQQTTDSLLTLTSGASGWGLYWVHPDGYETFYAALPFQLIDDRNLVSVPIDAGVQQAGFTAGDVFVPSYSDNGVSIARVTRAANGAVTVINPWVTFSGNYTDVELYLDRTGAFGDRLLALATNGTPTSPFSTISALYTIDGAGHTSVVASGMYAGAFGETSLVTVPNDPSTYGPLAGKALLTADSTSAYTVDPSGHTASLSASGLDNGSGTTLIPASANLFAITDDSSVIGASVADGSQFAPIQGQFLVAHEFVSGVYGSGPGGFDHVWWDPVSQSLKTQALAFTAGSLSTLHWERAVFLPAGLGSVPSYLEPGLPNWTVYVDTNHNGRLDPGEPVTTTDANGAYAFYNLPAGPYTVAEVPQAGWTQTQPAGGTYAVTLAAGQSMPGLDFGNQQNAVAPPPNFNDTQPPVFTSYPPAGPVTVGQTLFYNATATDPDGDALTFDLPVAPAGMAVDPHSGTVVWETTADQAGQRYSVLVRVTDANGNVALQPFSLTVLAADSPPVFTSTPITTAYAGLAYQYAVHAQAANNDTISFSLTNNPPTGMTVNATTGLISWPSPAAGSFSINLVATDSQGGVSTQTYTLAVAGGTPPADQPPVITSKPSFGVAIGQLYLYQVKATSPQNNPLTYSLTAAPAGMTIDPATGLISWTPTQAQYGNNTVNVLVTDSRGGSIGQQFTLAVGEQPQPWVPLNLTDPPLTATVGQLYSYNLHAVDPNSADPMDALSYTLLAGPTGMTLAMPDVYTSTLRWTPTADEIGNQTVTVQVQDVELGTSAIQSFTIAVHGIDQPPVITSTPSLTATTGQYYTYAVQASDADGDALTYSVSTTTNGPRSMTPTGMLTWKPSTAGSETITVTVTDAAGNAATQTFTVTINSVNYPPVITTTPPGLAVVGSAYSYQVGVVDQDNDSRTYSLSGAPSGMSISASGLLTWSTPVAGTYSPTITVTDALGAKAIQSFSLSVVARILPQISSTPPTASVTAGLSYRYDVQATDTYGSALSYSLNAPAGMTVDANGRVSWSPTVAQIGTYTGIVLTVTDAYGVPSTQTFAVTVVADTVAPTVAVQLSANPVAVGTTDTILVSAVDNVGVTGMTLTVNNVAYTLDSHGFASVPLPTVGQFTVVAKAWDAAGNSGTANATLTVINPNVTGSPTVNITSPSVEQIITGPVNIVGTASDPNLMSYTLTATPLNGGTSRTMGTGTASVTNGVLGVFDPTMLADGPYTLTLGAINAGGNTATVSITVEVTGHFKLGNFALSSTDLSIPVAGIPITIGRYYDTVNAATSEDFGYGWKLDYRDVDLQVNFPQGNFTPYSQYPAFYDGTRVYVTMPGGQTEGFTFQGVPETMLGVVIGYKPSFIPDTGVFDQLIAPDADLILMDGSYVSITNNGLSDYNPGDPIFGNVYNVVTPDRKTYVIDATAGKLLQISDRNNNTLTFTDNGIVSNTGRSVTFTRDPEDRITAITDPRGNSVQYAYDVNGNLVLVTDRVGNVTQYAYSTTTAHYLTTVIDADGVHNAQVGYDSSGRASQLTGATGGSASLSYTVAAPGTSISSNPAERVLETSSSTVTNPITGVATTSTTTQALDANGNVIRRVDAAGLTTTTSYNAENLPTAVTQCVGTLNFTMTTVYDPTFIWEPSVVASPTTTTYYSYDPNTGEETSVTDGDGNSARTSYDPNAGNVLSSTSPAGVTVTFTYDAQGDPTSSTLAGQTSTLTYDQFGNTSSSTDSLGNTITDTYDANGNLIGTSSLWTDPNDSSHTQTLTTSNVYDGDNRIVQSTGEDGLTTKTAYGARGNPVQSIDPHGNVTTTIYDALNKPIEVDSPDGTVTRMLCDSAGRLVYASDPFPAGTTDFSQVRGTETVYDADGRITDIKNVVGLHVDVSVNAATGVGTATYDPTSAVTTLSDAQTAYSAFDGQVDHYVDTNGAYTYPQYDSTGRKTGAVISSGPLTFPLTAAEAPSVLHYASTQHFDAASMPTSETDASGQTTHTLYDGDRNVTEQVNPDGSTEATHYNTNGQMDYQIDAVGNRTDCGYDAQGRLVTVTQPAVINPANGQSVRPVTTYAYDRYGDQTSITDANGHVTSFTYDALGRQTSETLPAANGLSATETTTYNSFGDVDTRTDFNGNVTKYIYDYEQPGGTTLGRLMEFDYTPTGSSTVQSKVTCQYDPLGRQVKVIETTGGVTRETDTTYDAENRVTQVTSPEGTIDYAYSDQTGLETKIWTSQSETDFGYDAMGRLQSVTESKRGGAVLSTPTVSTYAYDRYTGNTLSLTISSGASTLETTTYGYDPQHHWLTSVTNTDGSGNTLSSFTYTRRADGRINGETESVQQPDGSTRTGTETYIYDALDRLTQESWNSSAGDSYTIQYALDLVGNRLGETVTGTGAKTATDTYNARDELVSETTTGGGTTTATTFGYDANGSQTTVTANGILQQTNVYDARGRLVQVNNGSGAVLESILYTANGSRAAVTQNGVQTSYIVDEQSATGYPEVLEEYQNGALVDSYVYGLSLDPISQNTNAGGPGLSSVLLLSDGDSAVRQAYLPGTGVIMSQRFDAFGNTVAKVTATGNPFTTVIGYRGQRFDNVLGEYDLRARTYDPVSGRFTAVDPDNGTYNDPLQAMRYGYAGANPINGMDPTGMDSLVDVTVTVAINNTLTSIEVPSLTHAGIGKDFTGVGTADRHDWQDVVDLFSDQPCDIYIGLGAMVGLYAGYIAGYADALAADPLVNGSTLGAYARDSAINGAFDAAQLIERFLDFTGQSCFQAGTPILTPEGSRPIERIKAGDYVLSRDESDPTAPVQANLVEHVFRTESRLMYVTAGGRRIGTTSEHPFYVHGRGWTKADYLKVGDLLIGHDGATTAFEAKTAGAKEVVYNLRVKDLHTYFVGSEDWGFSVWAHNAYTPAQARSIAGRYGGAEIGPGRFVFPTRRAARQAASHLAGNLGPGAQAIRNREFRGGQPAWRWRNSNRIMGRKSADGTAGWRDDFQGHHGAFEADRHVNVWGKGGVEYHLFY
jgi:RHS repeat-associated protein